MQHDAAEAERAKNHGVKIIWDIPGPADGPEQTASCEQPA
jgi:hypothetical protein